MESKIKLYLFGRFQSVVRRIAPFLPKREFIRVLCAYYLDAYSGENNTDMNTDGELDFLQIKLSKKPGIKVFDIGSNCGNWCGAVLKINPYAEVHCFEPCVTTYKQLISRGFPENVFCNNYGLGAHPAIQQMHVFDDNSEWNSLYTRLGEGPQSVQDVKIDTVMNYCSRVGIDYIEFMKIDVEGNEWAVLQGAADLLTQHKVHIVQFEYAATFVYAGAKLKDIFELANHLDYDMYKIRPRGLIPIREFNLHLENFRNANYVLVSREGIGKKDRM